MTQKLPGLRLMAVHACACAPDLMVHGPSLRATRLDERQEFEQTDGWRGATHRTVDERDLCPIGG